MKIVNIIGGLGNQMFQYAFFLALKHNHINETLKVCTRSYGGYKLHNGLEIQRIFGISLSEASFKDLCCLSYPFFNYRSWQIVHHLLPKRKTMAFGTMQIPFDHTQLTRSDSVFYDGYWQNENNFKFIREKILQEFSFPAFEDEKNTLLVEKIRNCISVSCHVRRGDYLNSIFWNVCTPEYYENAIAKMNNLVNPDLYVILSNDIPWCKRVLSPIIGKRDIVFVDWNVGENSFRDMQLMSMCNHNIIANSSFSWWGAWLNTHKRKIIISPKIWGNGTILNNPICDDWVKL